MIVISLIDILMVLLIFLMATTTFRRTPVLSLELPGSRTARTESVPAGELVLTIAREPPHLYLDEEPVAPEELAERLRALAGEDATLTIRPDADVPRGFEWLVRALDSARQAGISRTRLATRLVEEEE